MSDFNVTHPAPASGSTPYILQVHPTGTPIGNWVTWNGLFTTTDAAAMEAGDASAVLVLTNRSGDYDAARVIRILSVVEPTPELPADLLEDVERGFFTYSRALDIAAARR